MEATTFLLQKKHYILKDNIYLRAVNVKDLERVDQITSVVNSAFVTNAGWTSISSLINGDKVTPGDIKALILETIDYERTKTQLLCAFERHPTKIKNGNNTNYDDYKEKEVDNESVIGTYLIKGGRTKFPASAQRTDQLENEIGDSECYYDLYCILPSYQSQGLGGKLQRAGSLYARDVLGYESAIMWAFENRTPELLACSD
ncbi:hypothetical protein INT45_010366 [Circinella minor]|uniref:Uncharacterized protein n=1 Tax=Circinella minor TaxID=1195481 RepID=A0A8H7S8C7_9FUNG|nr:hypothetical protein INT45_010366 [Circinella minor]